jgi:hypothetical protein
VISCASVASVATVSSASFLPLVTATTSASSSLNVDPSFEPRFPAFSTLSSSLSSLTTDFRLLFLPPFLADPTGFSSNPAALLSASRLFDFLLLEARCSSFSVTGMLSVCATSSTSTSTPANSSSTAASSSANGVPGMCETSPASSSSRVRSPAAA